MKLLNIFIKNVELRLAYHTINVVLNVQILKYKMVNCIIQKQHIFITQYLFKLKKNLKIIAFTTR